MKEETQLPSRATRECGNWGLWCFERARWSLRCAFPSTATCNGESQSIRPINQREDTIESQDGQGYTHKFRVSTDQQINTSTNPRNGFHQRRGHVRYQRSQIP